MFRIDLRAICCLVVTLALAAVFSTGCNDSNPAGPSGTEATFANIWPADMGNFWAYDVTGHRYESPAQGYERPEDVPPIPSMEKLYAQLGVGSTGTLVDETGGNLRLEFVSQNLSIPEVKSFKVERTLESTSGGSPMVPGPLKLLPTWIGSDSRIGAYDGAELTWLHLDESLATGHEFTVNLVPGLVTGLKLTSRVWRQRSCEVLGRKYENGLESFYVLDLGVQQSTDENGESLGYFRAYEYGRIVYVPEIGPVFCQEEGVFGPGIEGERSALLSAFGDSAGSGQR